ncbi:hypothetical protein [Nocardiopsis dassonvillei]|uniref:hypothetical protein n=1 Tax=Nocardiopsis dassonvillei TaxID=2014 RepID=UPI003672AB44
MENHSDGDIFGQAIQVAQLHGNLTVVHAAAVATTAENVLPKAASQIGNTSSWPNMHEALLELHGILSDWCEAAKRTSEALKRLQSQHLTRAVRVLSAHGPSNSLTPWTILGIPVRQGYLEMAQRDIKAVMAPAAPIVQRWRSTKRRQAARRTLRSLMHVYCPDLLEDFETAVETRSDWLKENRAKVDRALKRGIISNDLEHMCREAEATTFQLENVLKRLNHLLQAHYPMGGG